MLCPTKTQSFHALFHEQHNKSFGYPHSLKLFVIICSVVFCVFLFVVFFFNLGTSNFHAIYYSQMLGSEALGKSAMDVAVACLFLIFVSMFSFVLGF